MNNTKDNNITPTEKHKKYLRLLIENGGNKYKAGIGAGYSESMAKNPQKIEQSIGFQKLMAFYLPDSELLEENRKNWKQDADKGAKNKAIDTALRLKDRFPKEQTEFESGELTIKITKKE